MGTLNLDVINTDVIGIVSGVVLGISSFVAPQPQELSPNNISQLQTQIQSVSVTHASAVIISEDNSDDSEQITDASKNFVNGYPIWIPPIKPPKD